MPEDLDYKVDYDDPYSFHNWMTDEKLFCESDFMIGLFGSLFFVGFACSGILLKTSDYFGRTFVIKVGCFLQIAC